MTNSPLSLWVIAFILLPFVSSTSCCPLSFCPRLLCFRSRSATNTTKSTIHQIQRPPLLTPSIKQSSSSSWSFSTTVPRSHYSHTLRTPCSSALTFPDPAHIDDEEHDNNQSQEMQQRISHLRQSINNISRIRSSLSTNHFPNGDAILLVVNGRHTIFDSVTNVNPQIMHQLNRENVQFITDSNDHNMIHVVRPGFISFLRTLNSITSSSTILSVIVYSEPTEDMKEIDTLLSVLALIETHYHETSNFLKELHINGVIFDEKNMQQLQHYVPIYLFFKIIVCDHEGRTSWGDINGNVHGNGGGKQIVFSHTPPFNGDKNRVQNDSYFVEMNKRIRSFCHTYPGYPAGAQFVDKYVALNKIYIDHALRTKT